MLSLSVKPATRPPDRRDGVRLLVTRGEAIHHARFTDLKDFLEPGDLLVVNDSKMLPSALGDLHVSTELAPGRWVVEPRKHTPRELYHLPGGHTARLTGPYRGSTRLYTADVDVPDRVSYLLEHGKPIRYDYVTEDVALDEYQTVFGRVWGSAEMPSAGRPFTSLAGLNVASLTLHTGVSSLQNDEEPYPEWFSIPAATQRAVDRARRVIAVGTTVVRALQDGRSEGWTDKVIRPGDPTRVHGLLTGLHEPRSTHLWMLEAVGGSYARAYAEAEERGYLWHEFGDVHLML